MREVQESSIHESHAAAAPASGVLTIDLNAVVANWKTLRERVAPAVCAAAVKANAYGTGLAETGAALAAAGCGTFFVAVPSEGLTLRRAAPSATIYVLNGLAIGQEALYLANGLWPVLGSREEIAEWRVVAGGAGVAGAAAIHVDTGINRLGFTKADFAALIGETGTQGLGFPLALLMSHFVTSDDPDHPLNPRQITAFNEVRALCPDVKASLANSSGIFLGRETHFDMVRPGYALYGGNPTRGRENPMRGVVTLTVPIAQIRVVEAGETVGYDAQWTATGRRRIAILPIGYGDGYPRAATATDAKRERQIAAGQAIIAGQRCPFAGRVSMDLITVDVTEIPEADVRRGDPAILIGDDLPIDEVAGRGETIGYEVLTRLGRRYQRRYLR